MSPSRISWKWSKARARIALAIVVVCIGGAWVARRLRDRSEVQVTTASVTMGPIVRRIIATGTLQSVTTVEVGSQVSGTIRSLPADFNSIVHAGQVLATLDPALFDAELRQSQAALAEAQAAALQAQANVAGFNTEVEDAREKLGRAEALFAQQLIPQSDLDVARTAFDEANADLISGESQVDAQRAEVVQAEAAVNLATVNRSHTVIRSPLDGIVLARNVDVGQTVAASVQAPVLFNIAADLRHMQMEVDIDESDIGGVQPGEVATFEVASYPDETFQGTVAEVRLQPVAEQTISATTVAASIAPPSTTAVATVIAYATIIRVDNPDERLRPGMTATVTLDGARRVNTTRIPNSALSFRPPVSVLEALRAPVDLPPPGINVTDNLKTRQVWRYDGKRFTPVDVQTGLANSLWTELVSGSLRPGESLVTNASLVPRR